MPRAHRRAGHLRARPGLPLRSLAAVRDDDTPLGSTDASAERLSYVRSPDENWRAEGVAVTFAEHVAPPPGVTATGYIAFDGAELLLDPSTQDAVYLRYPDHTERWPRMAAAGCA